MRRKSERERERELNWSTVESLKNARSIFSHFFFLSKSSVFVFCISFLFRHWFVIAVFLMWKKRQQRTKNQYKNEKIESNELMGEYFYVKRLTILHEFLIMFIVLIWSLTNQNEKKKLFKHNPWRWLSTLILQ